jgi:hypothetical protein
VTGSNHLDGGAVARHTIDPADTAESLKAQGYIDGYENRFSYTLDPLSLNASARVYRWNTPESAKVFIQRLAEDPRRLEGTILSEGVTLTKYQKLEAPSVGEDAAAMRLVTNVAFLRSEFTATVVLWRRESLVASVGVLASDEKDRAPDLMRLAKSMDERIRNVLAGKTSAMPLVPTPTQTVPADNKQPSPIGGFRLAAMLPTLRDLPSNATMETDGPPEKTDALDSYERRFRPSASFIRLGSSEVTEIRATVGVYASSRIAGFPIQAIRSLTAEQISRMLQQGSSAAGGSALNSFRMDPYDFPPVGDSSAALMLKQERAEGEFDGLIVYFVRGQVRAQLLVIGHIGKIAVADVVSLAELMNQRIQDNSP